MPPQILKPVSTPALGRSGKQQLDLAHESVTQTKS